MKQSLWLVLVFLFVLLSVFSWAEFLSRKQTLSDKDKLLQIESMFNDYQKKFNDVPFIEVSEVEEAKISREIILVDVREKRERQVSIIPGSISKDEFEKDFKKYQSRKVIAYCTIGYRSAEYVRGLRQRGFDAYNLKGSILMWAHKKGKVVNELGPTRKVHVYGSKWNLLPMGWEGVW